MQRSTIPAGIFDSDHQTGENKTDVSQGGSEGHVWHSGNSWGTFDTLLINWFGTDKCKVFRNSDSLQMMIWTTLQENPPRQAEVLTDREEPLELWAEKGDDVCQLWPRNHLLQPGLYFTPIIPSSVSFPRKTDQQKS